MRLHELLVRRRDDIVQRWRERLQAAMTSSSVPGEYIIDTLPRFLEELIGAAKSAAGLSGQSSLPGTSRVASEHGLQRFEMGFDISGIVREYGVLRDCIFELAEEEGLSLTYSELRVLGQSATTGAAAAVERYAAARDQQVRELTARHMGFLAHELRNQLASASLAITTLEKRAPLEGERSFELLQSSLRRMRGLVDQSLIASRLQANLELDRERLDLRLFLEELVREVRPTAEDKRITIQLELSEGQLNLHADRRLLYSAMTNLLRNAVKFSRTPAEVYVRARRSETRILVEVEDQCGGIAPERITTMFDPFVQLGHDRSGFGLGLAIAKQATEAHNGDLRVHSIPERGCVFILDLPAA